MWGLWVSDVSFEFIYIFNEKLPRVLNWNSIRVSFVPRVSSNINFFLNFYSKQDFFLRERKKKLGIKI